MSIIMSFIFLKKRLLMSVFLYSSITNAVLKGLKENGEQVNQH